MFLFFFWESSTEHFSLASSANGGQGASSIHPNWARYQSETHLRGKVLGLLEHVSKRASFVYAIRLVATHMGVSFLEGTLCWWFF